ncbi:MAG TPA: putative metal-binding motif-containing protein, partial [Candidatus Polarisedimenticolaceae bacterium]|nr:putative metal-binding motif-containing protein [Candidatus Polarisedimenticolaceae bacterium]
MRWAGAVRRAVWALWVLGAVFPMAASAADCPDADGDGYGVCDGLCVPVASCGDCDDGEPAIRPGAAEVCNDLDDNCDGETDERNPGGGAHCATGQPGLCDAGTTTCVGGELVCVRDVDPTPEVCAGGLDEDCDGDVDGADLDCIPACPDGDGDGYAVCGAGCQLPAGKSCGDCDDARASVHPGAAETCNDRDDDCDGETDEGNPGGGAFCLTGQLGACALGHHLCQGGGLVCVPDASPLPEVCTGGLDEDCDGSVDGEDLDCIPDCPDADGDGYVVCGTGCQLPAGKSCGECDDGRSSVHPGAAESCNARDDDCDGQTDEGDPGGGASCDTGQQGLCAAGTETCQGGSLVCVRDQGPSAEICTGGLDEDCDGQVDTADPDCVPDCPDGDGDAYAVCSGGCQLPAGKTCGDCDDTRAGVHPGAAETCNALDDNCDGETDERNPGGGAHCDTGQQGVCDAGTRTCV